MDREQQLKERLKHMNNRTQWHKNDIKRIERLRNEYAAIQNGGELTQEMKAENKVVHRH